MCINNSDPLFSIVIPLYNRASLIKETIESVLNQDTEDPFEVIVIDDGSTDNSAAVVREIKDDRIKYFYQNNLGATTARNTGIDFANGKYVAFLDSDDKFLPHHLSAAKSVLQDQPNTVVYARIIVDRGNGKQFLKPPRALEEGEDMSEYLLCNRGFLQTSTVVIPTYLAKKVRYRVGLPYGQDTDFAIRLFAEGASFFMLNKPSAIWLDIQDNTRVSAKSTHATRLSWLKSIRPIITERAFYGDCGWVVAKGLAKEKKLLKALTLYSNALLKGCYKPSLAIIIFIQIVFPNHLFRKVADFYLVFKKNS